MALTEERIRAKETLSREKHKIPVFKGRECKCQGNLLEPTASLTKHIVLLHGHLWIFKENIYSHFWEVFLTKEETNTVLCSNCYKIVYAALC